MHAPQISVQQALALAETFRRSGREDVAETFYRRIVTAAPISFDAWNNLGKLLVETDRPIEAIECFRHALAIEPGNMFAHNNLGHSLAQAGQLDEAIACCSKAVQLAPDAPGAHLTLSIQLLLAGRYEEGWRHYEGRLGGANFRDLERAEIPRWDGRPLAGGMLLVYAEQGLGDTIQFFRYLPLLRKQSGAQIAFVREPALVRLFAENAPEGVKIVSYSNRPPRCDAYLPLLSSPLVLGQFQPVGMTQPCRAPSNPRHKLDPTSALSVGIVWSGRRNHSQDRQRSLLPELLRPLFDLGGITFYSLQIGSAFRHAKLVDLTSYMEDFGDSAGLMSQLDLIVTVDTAAAHLAGALKKPVWTLLPFIPDWRWGFEGETTPWYPTMRLFRQPALGDWNSVIQRVKEELKRLSTSIDGGT